MKIKLEKPEIKSVVSPWVMVLGVFAVWVIGLVLGNFINAIITDYVESERSQNLWLVIVYFVLSALIGVGLAFLITHITMRVIREINVNINKIAEGDFTARLSPITKNPHINSAVYNFNKMVEQLNSVAVFKNDFISSFTHEFKTPIASVKGYAELLSVSENLTNEEKEYLRIIIEESARLSVLCENTMALAKLDSESLVTEKRIFSLDGQIEDCILLFDNQLKEKGLEIEANLIPAKINSDPYLLKEVWINLLSNAVKYSGSGGKITVTIKRSKERYVVSVKDEGVGISEEAQKHMFDKYYQEDGSRSAEGIGLGLSLVKRALELTGGEIECKSEKGVGTEMIVTIDKNIKNSHKK
ncbi:MAG: HAMP domain-containing histidine kinase [Clostridia bacterium]|nr:HAMP domain-containing histidine kinase [Clostridia bacterium]